MSFEKDKKLDQANAVWARLRESEVSAPPYLETAVLARWRERRQSATQGVSFWKRWALASTAMCVVLMSVYAVSTSRTRSSFFAYVNQPFVVRIDLDPVRSSAVAKARIQLPPGVFFEIDGYPELQKRGELTLAWSAIGDWKQLPIVLKARSKGRKEIRISFLDGDNRVLFQRVVELELKES